MVTQTPTVKPKLRGTVRGATHSRNHGARAALRYLSRLESKVRGFTLVELLVVFTIIALLLTIAVPRYFGSLDRSKEAVLKENLYQIRGAIDKFYGDKGKYPETLDALVSDKYLRSLPQDPITESSASWVTVPPQDPQKGGVFDVKSGAQGMASDGTNYADW
jgi:general secretion pathway protein G